MQAKNSGEIRAKIIHQSHKNGDIRALEKKTVYNSGKLQCALVLYIALYYIKSLIHSGSVKE
jgi:hypothetical protein